VKPLDEELIVNSARKTKRVLTVEENVLIGGFGSGILEILSDRRVRGVEVMRLGVGDTFLEHGTQAELRRKVGIDEEGIFRASLALLGGEAGGMRKDLSVRYGKI
ncbi:MAG: 1-deoxy-D-xylulose-5-phosphate synthase, partial [Deltaproteobacteria bacterium]